MSTEVQDAATVKLLNAICPVVAAAAFSDLPDTPRSDIAKFTFENRRLPRIGDERAPWTYCGWMLPYVIDLHGHPLFGKDAEQLRVQGIELANIPKAMLDRGRGDCPDRWGYHLRTIAAGELLPEPIPRITFHGEFEPAIRKEWESESKGIAGWVRLLEQKDHHSSDGFRSLVDWFSWALAVELTPPSIGEEANEALYRTVNIEPWLLAPSDYLGQYLANLGIKQRSGFFPTPHHMCEMMVEMTMGLAEGDLRIKSVCDPCVGSGRMLLHASNYSLNLWGQDIDGLVVKICKINGALFAPWLAFPLPAGILPVQRPEPPPEPLPVEMAVESEARPIRVDDHKQGNLF